MNKKKILIFSGAGLDAESGIETFRSGDNGGLWSTYKVEEVASIGGWRKDKKKVLDFYNLRRREMKTVCPNKAHELIADLEKYFDVVNITQNVSNLLERAGSANVIHLHGELSKSRSTFDDQLIYDVEGDLNIGDLCPQGSQLRPNIVFFEEMLDKGNLMASKRIASEADVCIIVGSSMQVSPANSIPFLTPETALIYYVDPGEFNIHISDYRKAFFYHIKEVATVGMEKVHKELLEIFKIDV